MSHNYFWHKVEYYTQTKGVAMGANYAPSVANFFLNKWEEEQMYSVRRSNLKMYRRYIDNRVIIWKGTEKELQEFFDEVNHNIYGISFTGSWSRHNVDYLDLQVYKENGKLCTKTFFRKTNRNGYIPTNSCHHPQWIGNIPKGKLMHLHKNCSDQKYYKEQSNILINRLIERGYKKKELEILKEKVKLMNRDTMIDGRKNKKSKHMDMAFLTGYNKQYKSLEK